MYLEEELQKIVKDTGEIQSVYGGFEIRVDHPVLFPWHGLFNQLIEIGQQVWIGKREDKIYISSKPEAP